MSLIGDDFYFGEFEGIWEQDDETEQKTKQEIKEEKYRLKLLEFSDRHYLQARAAKTILNISLPKQDQEFFIIAMNVFSQFSFILTILELEGRIEELYVATYHTQKEIISMIEGLIKSGKIEKCTMIVSNMIPSWKPEVSDALSNLQESSNGQFEVIFAQNHAKISCVKTAKGNYYVVSGSGNVTKANQKMEQYNFTNSEELYKFYTEWFEDQRKPLTKRT